MIFFSSDWHLGHARLIELQRKQFKSVEEMNETIIAAWNEVVTENDTAYILGDVSYMNSTRTNEALGRMLGHKHLILGNHDKGMSASVKANFESVSSLKEIKVEIPKLGPNGGLSLENGTPMESGETQKQYITLCHYPMVTWNMAHYGSWNLHGHCHGNLREELFPPARRLDVGVDCWHFFPASLHEIAAKMAKKNYALVDHHIEGREYDR